jgi:hypothetical protein
MNAVTTAGWLLIAGSIIFLVGAAIGVPRIWTEPDPQVRLRLLREGRVIWVVAQPLYGLGALVAGVGAGLLAGPGGPGASLFTVGGAALVAGALAWGWSLYLRGTRIDDFVAGRNPGWPFMTYVLLTIAGLALLGAALLMAGFPAWLGWLTLGADLLFLLAYVWFSDIPPFFFYLLLLLVGVVLL